MPGVLPGAVGDLRGEPVTEGEDRSLRSAPCRSLVTEPIHLTPNAAPSAISAAWPSPLDPLRPRVAHHVLRMVRDTCTDVVKNVLPLEGNRELVKPELVAEFSTS